MLNQFFGHYLLNKGILTQVQLREILQCERSVKVKLGILAVNAGLMTAKQVDEIHDLQRIKDDKFGVLAIKQGYLTAAEVEQLLETQQEGHLSLMQVIADKGFMTLDAVEKSLANFRKEYDIPSGLQTEDAENQMVRKLVDFSAAGDKADLLYNYVGLLERNIIRFLNDTPFLFTQVPEPKQASASHWFVSQEIFGDESLSVGMFMNKATLLKVASRFYGEELSEVEGMAVDSVGEFLNVHNGVFCSSLSDQGIMIDLKSPVVKQVDGTFQLANHFVVIGTSFGNIEVVLAV